MTANYLPSPGSARVVELRRNQPGRPFLTYDGKPAPFPVVIQPALVGLPVLGQALAESIREGA